MTKVMETRDKLVTLYDGTGLDPRCLVLVKAIQHARPFRQDGKEFMASVLIETEAKQSHKIPCRDMLGAIKLRDTLKMLANVRGAKPKIGHEVGYQEVGVRSTSHPHGQAPNPT